jgi:hypothetical protein
VVELRLLPAALLLCQPIIPLQAFLDDDGGFGVVFGEQPERSRVCRRRIAAALLCVQVKVVAMVSLQLLFLPSDAGDGGEAAREVLRFYLCCFTDGGVKVGGSGFVLVCCFFVAGGSMRCGFPGVAWRREMASLLWNKVHQAVLFFAVVCSITGVGSVNLLK